MTGSRALRAALALMVCALAAAASLVSGAGAASTTQTATASQEAGTVETRLVLDRFTASGTKIVGHGTLRSTLRNAAGTTISTAQKAVKVTLQDQLAGPGPCQVLFLQLDELDLTLLGLHVHLYSATTGEPITLTLSADSTHGVLGKLFCDLSNATITTPTGATAAAQSLTQRLRRTTILHAQATVYTPRHSTRQVASASSAQVATDNCPVLHLILGPLHLDLLGLIADLNKVALDLDAVPGTTLGNLFCSLAPSTTTSTTTTTTTTATPPAPTTSTTTAATTPTTTPPAAP